MCTEQTTEPNDFRLREEKCVLGKILVEQKKLYCKQTADGLYFKLQIFFWGENGGLMFCPTCNGPGTAAVKTTPLGKERKKCIKS